MDVITSGRMVDSIKTFRNDFPANGIQRGVGSVGPKLLHSPWIVVPMDQFCILQTLWFQKTQTAVFPWIWANRSQTAAFFRD